MRKKHQPGCPCCESPCADGTYCVKALGCSNLDGFDTIYTSGFSITIVETDTETTVGTSSIVDNVTPVCFTLRGGTEHHVTISKPLWTTVDFTFTTPCTAHPWTLNPLFPMTPAPGYACPCPGGGCVDPVKLPLVLNDGLGDVTIDSGTTDYCVQRPSVHATPDCCGVAEPGAYDVPIAIHVGADCSISIAPGRWCRRVSGYENPELLLAAGDCDTPCFGQDPFSPCGSVIWDSVEYQCSPYRVTWHGHATGCLLTVYEDGVTVTLSES